MTIKMICPNCEGEGTVQIRIFNNDRDKRDFQKARQYKPYPKTIVCLRCDGEGRIDPDKDTLTREIRKQIRNFDFMKTNYPKQAEEQLNDWGKYL